MSSELQALRKEENIEVDFIDQMTGEIDFTLALIEEIQAEMKAEEAKMLAEIDNYETSLALEEEALCNAIEMLHTKQQVTCPICLKNTLLENKGVIFCKCGVRINTEQDGVTLDFVQHQLEEGQRQHECDANPQFSIQDKYGITNLLMTCQVRLVSLSLLI